VKELLAKKVGLQSCVDSLMTTQTNPYTLTDCHED